jgi:HPt (histidine-containing phosphotransfer) domain-containing protein
VKPYGNRHAGWICLAAILMTPILSRGEEPAATAADALDEAQSYQAIAGRSQARVEDLDDAALAMLSQYNSEVDRYEDLRTYNENLRELLASQRAEKERLNAELAGIETVRQEIVPLMVQMIDVLESFVTLDKPLLIDERTARLETLRKNLTRSDVDLAERYRRIIEAYQIEAEYGQTIEAYEGPIVIDDRELTVDFLRVGRIGLYYLSLDRAEGGIWDPAGKSWTPLAENYLDDLDLAVRMARKQAPPNLMDLPMWTTGSES